MSIVPPETPEPNEVVSAETFHFDFPGSDLVLRSCDSHDFCVLRLYIANISPILRELLQSAPHCYDTTHGEEPLPVVKLSERGTIISSLLTFIFPVAPVLPSTTEQIMELLAVAQKYQMDLASTFIRGTISRLKRPCISPETSLHDYFLAQKHGLHQEAVQAARGTLRLSMTIEGLEDKIRFMPGSYLLELWNYHKRIRTDLKSALLEFKNTQAGFPDNMKGLQCSTTPPSTADSIPQWLNEYITSISDAPHLFDYTEFESVRARHINYNPQRPTCHPCGNIPSQAIRAFWEALTAAVHGTIEKVRRTGMSGFVMITNVNTNRQIQLWLS